jgi:hypothetical protein
MKTNIVIVDDFLDDPYEMRLNALNANYPEPTDHTYPGKNSDKSYFTEEMLEKIQNRWGDYLIPAEGSSCGYFRISLERDTFEQNIHIDPGWDVGGVLYLNTPNQCRPESGTHFYYHNRLGIERAPATQEEGKFLGFTSYEEIRKNVIYGDGLDKSLWTRYASSPMKYNRLVLFDPLLWHSHGDNFGDSLDNGRLVMLFFFTKQK